MKPGDLAKTRTLIASMEKERDKLNEKVKVTNENIVDIYKEMSDLSQQGKTFKDGRIVSPEIEQENNRRRFASEDWTEEMAEKVLLKRIDSRTSGKLEFPEGIDIEKTIIESGAYKLGTGPHHITQVNRQLIEAVLVKIQNVRDYYVEHWKEHKWDQICSFTCVRMPFPKMVFSYDHPFNPPNRVKVIRHVNVTVESCSLGAFAKRAIDAKCPDLNNAIHEYHLLNPNNMIRATVAIDGFFIPGEWFVAIDKSGQILTNEQTQLGWIWVRDAAETLQLAEMQRRADERYGIDSCEEFEAQVTRHCSIAMAAIQFMNCRNVEILDNGPTRQQRRQAEREGRKPDVTYKTLVIHPMGKKRITTRNPDGTPVSGISLHIVRGHFKNYVEGKGLGRAHLHGIYWWSPMVRGKADVGRVEKDYEVKP
jgi:hypothetical protein